MDVGGADHEEIALRQLLLEQNRIVRQETERAQFRAAIAGCGNFVEIFPPSIGIAGGVGDAP
jgi:hypothetical protein